MSNLKEMRLLREKIIAGGMGAALPPMDATKHQETYRPDDFTDVGNAHAFVRLHKSRLIYVRTIGWLVWQGKYWRDDSLEAQKLAVQFTDSMVQEANGELKAAYAALATADIGNDPISKKDAEKRQVEADAYRKHALRSRQSSRIDGMLKIAQGFMKVDPEELDADAFLLNTPAFLYDLRTGEVMEHDPNRYCTKITKCSPSDNGCELWQAFLSTISQGNEELMDFLQQIAGMAAVGKVFEENLIVALGNGKNGKSALFNTLAAVLHTYSGTLASDVLTVNNQNKGAELATLKGVRLVIASETDEGARLSGGAVKQLCSTDKIRGARKYKDPEDFVPSHTTILYTNHLPHVHSTDEGIWRRLVVVPFDAKISSAEEVKNYSDFLVQEAGEAILRWIIQGSIAFIDAGYTLRIPDIVKKRIMQYRQENDWMGAFLEECCILDNRRNVGSGALYNAYAQWAERSGERKQCSRVFKAELERQNFENRKGNKGVFWYGIGLG